MTYAFPLSWPTGRSRSKWFDPKKPGYAPKLKVRGYDINYVIQSQFRMNGTGRMTIQEATNRLETVLTALAVKNFVVTSNLLLDARGVPVARQGEPKDRGVAVFFAMKGKDVCFPCDRYDTVADNLTAVASHLVALRAAERHGVASCEEMFSNFLALPPPSQERPWREVFGFKPEGRINKGLIESTFKRLAKASHPDHGGSLTAMQELNRAHDDALASL